MKDTIYIVVCRQGFIRALKTHKFDLAQGERAFRLDLDVPDEAFAPPLLPTVRMTIPRDALITTIDVTAGAEEGTVE